MKIVENGVGRGIERGFDSADGVRMSERSEQFGELRFMPIGKIRTQFLRFVEQTHERIEQFPVAVPYQCCEDVAKKFQ